MVRCIATNTPDRYDKTRTRLWQKAYEDDVNETLSCDSVPSRVIGGLLGYIQILVKSHHLIQDMRYRFLAYELLYVEMSSW